MNGPLAQLVERDYGIVEVSGSTPLRSTKFDGEMGDKGEGRLSHCFYESLLEYTPMILSKKCKNCGDVFFKKPTDSLRSWQTRRKFCSTNCFDQFRRGKPSPSPSTTFKKGQHIPVPLRSRRRGPDNYRWRGGPILLKCAICTMPISVERDQFLRGAKTCSRKCANALRRTPDYRERMSMIHRQRVADGLHNCYRGVGKTQDVIRDIWQYEDWRTKVFERDGYTCTKCGQRGGRFNLNVDHIKPFAQILEENNINSYNTNYYQDAIACNELWDIRNGRTLCVECHRKTPTYGGRLKLSSFPSHIPLEAALWYQNVDVSMGQKRIIEYSFLVLIEAYKNQGIDTRFWFKPVLRPPHEESKSSEEDDFEDEQYVCIETRVLSGSFWSNFSFSVMIPEPTSREVENWANQIAYNFGHAFNHLNGEATLENRIEFLKRVQEVRNELNKKARENMTTVCMGAIPAVL